MKTETKPQSEVIITPEEDYRALLRSLRRRRGFGLLFVECSEIGAKELVLKVKNDIPHKQFSFLELSEPTDNLYDLVAAHIQDLAIKDGALDVLFIRGLEYSIFEYEDREYLNILERSQSMGYGGSWTGVPPLFGHLNLSRERFRDNFSFCLVFLVPEFVLRYFSRRAPDFFDWRSSVYRYPTDKNLLVQESFRLADFDDRYEEYGKMTSVQRIAKLSQIRACIDENSDRKQIADLWFEKGLVHASAEENEKAIASNDKTLEIKPDSHEALNNRGAALGNLGRHEEAIASYDKALEIKPDYHAALYNRGAALVNLGRYEEAIASCDKALEIKPDFHEAWNNRGIALGNLGRNEEAIASYDQAIKIKPDNDSAIYNKSCTYALQCNLDLALDNLGQAILLSLEEYREMAKTDSDFDSIRHDPRFQELIQ